VVNAAAIRSVCTLLATVAVHSAEAQAAEPHVQFQVLSTPEFRSSKPVYMAINSQDEWVAFLKLHNEDSLGVPSAVQSLPMIDFKKHTLLVATSGTKPNLGYSIAFASVREFNGVTVSVLDIEPGVNCPTAQELTNPRAWALIPKTGERVAFTVVRAIMDCKTRAEMH
jgi:hypothetical protein